MKKCYLHLIILLFISVSCNKQVADQNSTNKIAESNFSSATAGIATAIIFCTRDSLYAFNSTNGQVIWAKKDGIVNSTPVIYNGLLIYNQGQYVKAISIANGALKWSSDNVGPCYSSLCAANNKIYLTVRRNIICLNAANGSTVWMYYQSIPPPRQNAYSAPTVANGTLYVGGNEERVVYALNAQTGAVKWKFTDPHSGYMFSNPCIYKNKVIVSNNGTSTYALDTATGNVIWEKVHGFNFKNSPTILNDRLYLAASQLYCFNPNNGNTIWSFADTSSLQNQTFSDCFANNGKVYSFFNDQDYGVNAATGIISWNLLTERVDCGAVETNGILYFQGYDSFNFYAVNALTGSILWKRHLSASGAYSGVIAAINGNITYPLKSGMQQ